jgi:hypothetical protein
VFAYYEWVAPFVGWGYRDGAFGFAPAWSASLLHALRCGRVSVSEARGREPWFMSFLINTGGNGLLEVGAAACHG